jgi:hypothetical protein
MDKMKKSIVFIFVALLMVSCKQEITESDLSKINGYWEIEKVILSDGEAKAYKINETIDYFQIKDKDGFRKKVMPQLDGTYLVNNQKQIIKISQKEGIFFMNYTTPFGKWQEEIIEITSDKLVFKNQQNLEYHYKKPIPFSIK